MHECCSIKVPKSDAKHWTKSIKGLCHRSELIWLTFEHQSAPEKLCTRRRDICEFDVERYLLNFANLSRMSVAWKLFQEHYHYFLGAEIRRRKAATNARFRVSLSILLWGFEVPHFEDIHISFLKWRGQRPRAALKGRVDQYQVWTCLLLRICIPAMRPFLNLDKYILQCRQIHSASSTNAITTS